MFCSRLLSLGYFQYSWAAIVLENLWVAALENDFAIILVKLYSKKMSLVSLRSVVYTNIIRSTSSSDFMNHLHRKIRDLSTVKNLKVF